jgi:hypothetical protein
MNAIDPIPEPPLLHNQFPILQLHIGPSHRPIKDTELPTYLFANPRITLRKTLPPILIHQNLIHNPRSTAKLLRQSYRLEPLLLRLLLLHQRLLWLRRGRRRRRRIRGLSLGRDLLEPCYPRRP